MSIHQTSSIAITAGDAKTGRLIQSAMAIFFGLFIVGFVGFSPLEIVHNAAHDTRHANSFPCH